MSILEIKHLTKSFGENEVLKDINMTVNRGQVVSVIGPSGSGKSTLLRCATTLEKADGGEISYDGITMIKDGKYADKNAMKKIKQKFGLVFQSFNLFPHMSILRNITEAPVCVLGMKKEQAEKEAMELLEKMGLGDKADSYPFQLSGGQQQRVSIARALAMHPDVLFFDEPTSALDPELTGEILKVIRELAEEKMTMVIVTHEIVFAREVSDYVVFMDNGYIVEEGDAHKVINNPQSDRLQLFLSKFNQ
ncbi:MAG: amino acid ABC transporter ATP-binding protein [Ruminococcaceae bacterium]|nr:amino acid ABC transporter ATP-binding protein [Oscillospiraceae bacterium]